MMKKINTTVFLLTLAVPALAVAAGEIEIHGVVEAGAQTVNVNGNNKAKFNEYSDIQDGFIGSFQFDALKDSYFLEAEGNNLGLDDQSLDLEGGRYGDFKYKFYYDKMPHNYSSHALSFYQGLGTNRLVLPVDPTEAWRTSTDTWTTFDYEVQHKKYGGEISMSFQSPFFFTIGAEQREQDGTRPYSVRQNIEVPNPIDYKTDNLNIKTGYLGENISASITGYYSSFKNDNKFLSWEDLSNNDQNAVLDPDNDFSKLGADFSWRQLPLNSALAASASYSNLSNNYSATDVNVNADTIGNDFNNLNQTTFDGDIDYYTFSMALVSMPMAKLDSRLYYRYVEKNNNSSHIFYNDGSGDNYKELLSYDKNTAGIDLGYRLPYRTKLDAGYEYDDIDRSTEEPAYVNPPNTLYRYDNPSSTTDNTAFVQLKNSSLDWLTTKVKYTHLDRDSDDTGTYDPYANEGVTRFDATDKTMDEVKVGFEFYPLDSFDIGIDYTYQDNDYKDNRETRTDDKRQSVYLDMAWRAYKKATISGFLGFENTKTDANRITSLQDETIYAQTVDDDFWTYGLALNVPDIINKLTLNFSWQYQKSNGKVKFDNSFTGDTVTGRFLVDIPDSDDYSKRTFEAKAIYEIDPKFFVTVGYMYESYKYSDIAYTDYQYILGNDYYSGAYYDQDYTANVGYVTLGYNF